MKVLSKDQLREAIAKGDVDRTALRVVGKPAPDPHKKTLAAVQDVVELLKARDDSKVTKDESYQTRTLISVLIARVDNLAKAIEQRNDLPPAQYHFEITRDSAGRMTSVDAEIERDVK